MLTLYRITLAPARKPYRIGLLFTHNNGDFRRDFCNGRNILFFLWGRLENFHKQILFLYAAPAGNKFFCDFVFLRTLYFLLAYNLFQCLHFLQSANDLSQNFPEESHLLSHILHTRCSIRVAYGFGTKSHPEWCA